MFSDIEEEHWWWRSRRAIILDLLDRLLPEPGPHRVLDFGCGLGAMLRALPPHIEGYGVDASERAVEGCHRHGMARVLHSPGPELPFSSGFFNGALALDVLEHLDEEGPLLRELGRVMKEDGSLIATAPAFPWLWTHWDELNQHRRRYTRQTLSATLDAHGFRVRFCSYMNFFLFPLAMLRRISEIRKSSEENSFPAGARIPSPGLNRLLAAVFGSERLWLNREKNLPWGSSLIAIAQKRRP